MLDILRKIGSEYQDAEDERLYGGGASGGMNFLFGGHPGGNRPQRNKLGDMLTGKMARRKKKERKAGEAIAKYFGLG